MHDERRPVPAYVAAAERDTDGLDAVVVTPPVPAIAGLSFAATFSAKGPVRETTASKLRSAVAAASALKSHAAGISDGKVLPSDQKVASLIAAGTLHGHTALTALVHSIVACLPNNN